MSELFGKKKSYREEEIIDKKIEPENFTVKWLSLSNNYPRMTYRRRTNEIRKSVHWGQRKLLISEILFLSLFYKKEKYPNGIIVVYAGSAPGHHLIVLMDMFKNIKWELYDPRDINSDVLARKNVTGYKKYFLNEDAEKYSGLDNVFFICDIRSADSNKNEEDAFKKYLGHLRNADFNESNYHESPDYLKYKDLIDKARKEASIQTELEILQDMKMQEKWTKIINPVQSYLKFHLPYVIDKDAVNQTNYFKGHIFWQTWEGPSSTETRLIPVKDSNGNFQYTTYDNLIYEENCFYHNFIVREKLRFLNPLTGEETYVDEPHLLDDYDSCNEALVLKMYLRSKGLASEEDLAVKVVELSRIITTKLLKHAKAEGTEDLDGRRKEALQGKGHSASYFNSKKKVEKLREVEEKERKRLTRLQEESQ